MAVQGTHGVARTGLRWAVEVMTCPAPRNMGSHRARALAKQAQLWVPTPPTAGSSSQNLRAHQMLPHLCLLPCGRQFSLHQPQEPGLKLLLPRMYHLYQLSHPNQVCSPRFISQKATTAQNCSLRSTYYIALHYITLHYMSWHLMTPILQIKKLSPTRVKSLVKS